MKRHAISSRRLAIAAAACLAAASAAQAQDAGPRLAYVYPAGGRQGQSFEVRVAGQRLQGVEGAYVSGQGVQAKVLERIAPITPNRATQLRDRLKELQQQPRSADTVQEIAEIRAKLYVFASRPSPEHVQVKAAGGVRTLDRLLEVRALGVTRVGASRTVEILTECKRRL